MSNMKLQDFATEVSTQFPMLQLHLVEGPKPTEVGGHYRKRDAE